MLIQQIQFDFTSLPFGFVIDVILATLATVPNEKWNTAILVIIYIYIYLKKFIIANL